METDMAGGSEQQWPMAGGAELHCGLLWLGGAPSGISFPFLEKTKIVFAQLHPSERISISFLTFIKLSEPNHPHLPSSLFPLSLFFSSLLFYCACLLQNTSLASLDSYFKAFRRMVLIDFLVINYTVMS